MNKMYVYAKLSKYDLGLFRLGALGLGNLLFPWARALVYARTNSLPMIWPTWNQFGIGPMVRRQADFRTYSGIFVPTKEYLVGISKIKVFVAQSNNIVTADNANLSTHSMNEMPGIIVFSGLGDMFLSIESHHDMIRSELLSICRKSILESLPKDLENSIAVHVRLGDFSSFDNNRIKDGLGNTSLPIDWYVEKICQIRAVANYRAKKVYVFSDGDDKQLSKLLELDNVERYSGNSAMADILAISMSAVLVASSSTFSMWGSFLGRMPVIWYRGGRRLSGYSENTDICTVSGLGEQLDSSFISALELEA